MRGNKKILRFFTLIAIFVASGLQSLAQNVLDLRAWDAGDARYLNVQSQFHYGELLSAEQMDTIATPQYVQIPSTWDEYPGAYNNTGVATYYLKIVGPSKVEELSLDARTAGTSYKLFCNAQLLGELGKVGYTAEEAKPKYQNIIYSLPRSQDTLKLIYHVSNFSYRKGGLWRAPILGNKVSLQDKKEKKLIIDFFLWEPYCLWAFTILP